MRDLDDLLDPVVSRRASAAARTPDFAAVERRGQQRRRRARVTTVGAVVAVVAAVSVVGTQVASDRADTAPAGTIEWEGPDGELARMAESGKADPGDVVVAPDGSVLTRWTHFGSINPAGQSPFTYGFSLAVDGETYWSPLAYQGIEISRLASDAFVVGLRRKEADPSPYSNYVADASGMRPLVLMKAPADLAGGSYDGYVWLLTVEDVGVYAVDVDSATAAPVSELMGVLPDFNDPNLQVPQTDDGDVWVVTDRPGQPPELVHMAPDGRGSAYTWPAGSLHHDVRAGLKGVSVSRDGRPVLVWVDGTYVGGVLRPPVTLKVTTVTASGALNTADLGASSYRARASAAALPDGRLLVSHDGTLLRSSDESWSDFDVVAAPDDVPAKRLRRYALTATDHSVCLTPSYYLGANLSGLGIHCTVDGDSWESVDLTP